MDSNHESSSSFWRNNGRAVPGRPSPKKDQKVAAHTAKVGKGQLGSFQDYQQSVSDAWDLGDDEFCIITGIADTKISKRASQSAAFNVIQTHRTGVSAGMPRNQEAGVKNHHDDNDPEKENDAKHKEHLGDNGVQHLEDHSQNASSDYSHGTRLKFRQFHAYPGRPQLQKLSSSSSCDAEYESKIEKFSPLLDAALLDLIALKKLSWSGIPKKVRAVTWRLLSEYLPTSLERRDSVLERKRLDYHNLVAQYFRIDSRDEAQQDTYRQIHIDVPRMNPHVPLFQQKAVQDMFERILFIWAIRHPASGYVQGINDLVTPFFIVFLQEIIGPDKELENVQLEDLSLESRNSIEADSFWCLSKFLDCIQDNYIFAQLGIQAKVNQLKDLIQRIDGTLHKHLQLHGVDYLQFSFRWMNNLLTRELPLHCTIRLWDTYLAESDGFAVFHLYVCAAFLLHWREQLLQQKDFQGLMLLLQNLPTHNWADRHISVLVAEAFKLKFTYADTPKHLEGKS
ncbi:unnamed protein product [Hermetia illucens]|uniref:Rab-GAP TBC domain-containing protein n=2 Tax=Hermetia illucens TaxID=343691 RepID=A0A7R8YZZ6_HERIL|nr:unnamed protein product [Hermetia illucens]